MSVVSSTGNIVLKEPSLPIPFDKPFDVSNSVRAYTDILESEDNAKELLIRGKIAYSYCAYSPILEVGPAYFELDAPSNITLLSTYLGPYFLSGGTWTNDGRWFTCQYSTGLLWLIETNGDWYVIGGGGASLNGLAYNPVNNKLYGASAYALYEIDINTGEQDYIGSFNNDDQDIIGIAFDADGVLYAWDVKYSGDSFLYTVDILTGQATIVGSLGLTLCYAQDGAFDYETDTLYLSAYVINPDYGGYLIECDEDTGNCNIIGQFEGYAELDALAIPYNWSGPTADFTWAPSLPNPDETISFNASASYDPDDYITLYEWDWNNDGVSDENHTIPTATHSWSNIGYYPVTLKITDNVNLLGMITKTVRVGNQPPEAPTIDGPTRGKPGVELCWTFNSTDQDNDSIFIFVDWGDGTFEDWFGPYLSPIELCHTYEEKKTYTIRAKVKDIYGAESDWAEFEVTIPRNKMSFNSLQIHLFEPFFERFPLLEVFLRIMKI